jgi:CheY-like chemotaxis protein
LREHRDPQGKEGRDSSLVIDSPARGNYGLTAIRRCIEALALWQSHHDSIDLLLTDMRMPKGMSGLELAEKLRSTKPSLKVVMMSGYSLAIVRTCAGDCPAVGTGSAKIDQPLEIIRG